MHKNEAFSAFFEAKMTCFLAVFGVLKPIKVTEIA